MEKGKNKRRVSYSIPEDVKQEIREMFEDGLYPANIANYMGVNKATVDNICKPKLVSERAKRYYPKNREKCLSTMKKYAMRRKFTKLNSDSTLKE